MRLGADLRVSAQAQSGRPGHPEDGRRAALIVTAGCLAAEFLDQRGQVDALGEFSLPARNGLTRRAVSCPSSLPLTIDSRWNPAIAAR
jgi:hypothetical protein